MLANSFIVLLLFLYHEGFYLLPERLTIIPGVFRMSDAIFLIIPFFFLSIPKTFSQYKEESLLVLSFCILMLISCLMGHLFFPQTYFQGMLSVRRNFFWLSFFVYIPLIKNLGRAEKLIDLLTFLCGIYLILLLLTKYFPNLGIIHFTDKFYQIKGGLKRFGEFRLFFPYGNISVMLYFIAISQTFQKSLHESIRTKIFRLLFILLALYVFFSSLTRTVIFPVLFVTAYVTFRSNKRILKVVAISTIILLLSFQGLTMALNDSDETFLKKTLLGKMIFQFSELEPENGRKFQALVYFRQFMRSPLTGVGNFAVFDRRLKASIREKYYYRKYKFFSASDLGYMKILGENGLLGIAWVFWWFSYFYRRCRQAVDEFPVAGIISRGLLFFTLYQLISGVTFGHWVHPNFITILPLSLALMAITRVFVEDVATSPSKDSSRQVSNIKGF